MARFRRLVVPGYPHHVTQRGVRRQTTFFDEHDYRRYIRLASELLDTSSIEILAYCLMPNHVHAVVIPAEASSLAKFFGPLHKAYAQYTNLRYEWAGHLWQARYYSVPMNAEHTLTAMRYVELNPIRSGLENRPQDWLWSSARGNLGLVDDPLIPDRLALGIVPDWAAYLSIPEKGAAIKQLRRRTNTGRPAGDESFIRNIESLTGRQVQKQRVGRKPKLGD
jgi:putative transposase